MVKQFLITRPNYDRETSYIHSFSKGIIAYAKGEKDIHMTELEGRIPPKRILKECWIR